MASSSNHQTRESLNGSLANGSESSGRRNGNREQSPNAATPLPEQPRAEFDVNGILEEPDVTSEAPEHHQSQYDHSTPRRLTLHESERGLPRIDNLVTVLNAQIDNLIRELDRLPVPAAHIGNDVWVARLTHETMRSLARRMAVLLWFYHMGDGVELD
ncbi:hypothetical protein PRZ48_013992 [Zasmidium cellare]|uniref:Uncharacterized protein n=1 Tax=Zasmidium cellare TaxID=395010 RepID=A0ABR0E0B6_ZASCE|nr:hypothetical protein PRZ48_013992 [Zasmidium cellare]